YDDPLDDREIQAAEPDQTCTQLPHRLLDRDCYVLTSEHDVIALDRQTLWPVSIQRQDGSTAEVWDMRVNTGPSMSL
ncbi:MAG: hypothetical protein ACYCW6_22805, partial [Candidatus Xenobia bacterium]